MAKSAIAFHLPATDSQYPSYNINNPVRLKGESYPGPISFRRLFMLHGQELSLPTVGKKITVVDTGTDYSKSLNVTLKDEDSNLLGYKTPYFHNATAHYQSICAFLVEKRRTAHHGRDYP